MPKRVQQTYPDLKTWRDAFGLSQMEAARILGISQISYSRYEGGRRFVKGDLAKRIMARTRVPLEKLAGVA